MAGVLRARRGRKFFEVLKKMVPGMMHSLVPIVFFVLIIMGMSSLSFDNLIEEFKSTAYTSYNWLFLIFTNDNFDRLLPGSIMVNMSYLLFFFPAIYVGQRFLLSLIIGDTYETFRSYVKKQLKKEKLKEMQGLTKAFAALDDRKCGVISDFVFKECMTCLHPGMSDEVIALYYELLSGGGVNGVNVLQFLSLRKVLSFKLTVSDQRNYFWNGLSYIKHHAKALYNNIHFPVPCALVESAGHVREYLVNSNWLDYLNIFDIIIFCFDLSEQGVLDKVLGPVYNQFTWCQFISLLYCAEFLIRIVAGKGELGTVSSRNNFVSFLFGIGCLGTILCDIVALVDPDLLQSSVVSLPYGRSFAAVKTLVFFRLLRCVRMANLNEDLKDFTAAIMDIIPALSETFLFTFIVTYIFGTLGHILFGAHMEEWSTPLRSIVKAQQLTFMVSYLDSMESAMETIHPLAILYFAFYLVLSLTVSNIALSIIIDLHGSVLDANTKKNRDAQQKKLDLVFNKIISNARVRHLFSSRNKSLNFKNITLSEFQTSDVRHFITDSSNEKNLNTGT
ncbi:ion transporter [archaeon]|nr:MAG: ion transporter [archaeon]